MFLHSHKRDGLEENICRELERYRRLEAIVTPRQFLDQIAIAYLEFYADEKLSRKVCTRGCEECR